MYMSICELTLGGDKTIELECVASVKGGHGKLVYFVNFEKFALAHRPPTTPPYHPLIARIRYLCCAPITSWSLLDNNKKLIEWRDHELFRQLDTTGMISLWGDILRNSNFTSIDSTDMLHLKNSTVFVRLEGFYALCRAIFSENEYARAVVSMVRVLSGLQQRHLNDTVNSQVTELNATVSRLNELIKTMYMENRSLHRQVRFCKDLFLKTSPKVSR